MRCGTLAVPRGAARGRRENQLAVHFLTGIDWTDQRAKGTHRAKGTGRGMSAHVRERLEAVEHRGDAVDRDRGTRQALHEWTRLGEVQWTGTETSDSHFSQ